MISSDNRHYRYGKGQLIEVICQLRFPTILSPAKKAATDLEFAKYFTNADFMSIAK